MHVDYLAIILGTVLSFLFSTLYYILLNKQVTEIRTATAKQTKSTKFDVRTTTTPNKIIIELTRTFILGLVIAYACSLLGLTSLSQAALLAFWLWIGLPVVMLVGFVIHEHFPLRLAAIHAGDWLVKLLIFSIILTLWR